MTPFGKLLRRVLEKWAAKFYEGPNPPHRLWEQVRLFRMHHPNASIDEWEDFSVEFARASYQEGYTRGYEWAERDLDSKPAHDPEVLAAVMRHDWSLSEASPRLEGILKYGDPNNPLAGLPEEHQRALLDHQGLISGGYRVVIEEVNKKKPGAQ